MDKKIIKRTVIYEGLFVYEYYDMVEGCLLKETPFDCASLENPINYPHVTVSYRPTEDHSDFYGARAYVIVKAYGNDGVNEGWLVDIIPDSISEEKKELCKLFGSIKFPHITLSVSNDGKPVDTSKLHFDRLPMEGQRVLECRFGAFIVTEYDDGTKKTNYEFYKPYKRS